MARQGKVLDNRWSNTVSTVRNIVNGGTWKLENYDPSEMSRVWESLNAVSDFANGVAPEEIETKYNSIPNDVLGQLSTQSHWVSSGSMSNYQLKAQAKDYGYKLSENELDYLQKHPWVQKSYLEVKKNSSMWETDQMEEMMATILKDIKSGKLQNKGNLKTRLQNYLRMGNGADLDYLTDDLWSDFTANMTDGEKMQRIRSKYKELFWFEDRTWAEKLKRWAVGLLNGVKKATVNWLAWLTEAWSDATLSLSYWMANVLWLEDKMAGADTWDSRLWWIDDNALSPDTKEAVDYLRAYGLGTWMYDALDVYYDAMHETWDAKIANFYQNNFADFWYGYWVSSNVGEDIKSSDIMQENDRAYKAWEFIGKSIPEIYVTSKIGALMGLSPETMAKLPRWAKFGYRIIKSGTEWVAFSAMEEWEVDPTTVGVYTAMGTIVEPATNALFNKVSKWWVRKRMWKNVFRSASEDVMNSYARKWLTISRNDAEKIVTDVVLEWSMGNLKKTFKVTFAWNSLDKASTFTEEYITELQKSIVSDLSKVTWKYENKYTRNMLEWIFWQSKKEVEEAYSVFRNARIGAWETEEAVAKEWDNMLRLYKEWTDKFTLLEQENIKQNARTIADTYSKSDKPLNGSLNERWRDQQISSQNLLKDYATQQWISDLWDRYLQESVLIRAKAWFEKSATTSMSDIINRYAWRTLIWGLWAYTASQVLDDWPLSNPYVATATTILIMSMWGSPRSSLLASKIASKLSTVEAYSLINEADSGTLFKLKVREPWQWSEGMKGVIYTDTIQQIMERMEDNSVQVDTRNVSNNEYLNDMIKNKYGLY